MREFRGASILHRQLYVDDCTCELDRWIAYGAGIPTTRVKHWLTHRLVQRDILNVALKTYHSIRANLSTLRYQAVLTRSVL